MQKLLRKAVGLHRKDRTFKDDARTRNDERQKELEDYRRRTYGEAGSVGKLHKKKGGYSSIGKADIKNWFRLINELKTCSISRW